MDRRQQLLNYYQELLPESHDWVHQQLTDERERLENMKVYIVSIETRKHDRNETLGLFSTFEKARKAFMEGNGYWNEERWKAYTKYGSSYEKGILNTEEESVEIYEREVE